MALVASLVKWIARGILFFVGAYLSLGFLLLSIYSIGLVMSWMTDPPKGESYLWRINPVNGSPPSYLYGTIHIPYDLFWPSVPQNTKEALKVSFTTYCQG